jgi:protein-S-isoprenylcysteine O-methyltransferase Ste14
VHGLLITFVGTTTAIGVFLTLVAIVIGIATIRVSIKTEEVILSEKNSGRNPCSKTGSKGNPYFLDV